MTYSAKIDAEAWLAGVRRQIELDIWTPPEQATDAPLTFGAYAEKWLAQRRLKPRTRGLYADQLRLHIVPTFGELPLRQITPAAVRSWYAGLGSEHPTRNAKLYALLRTILGTAVEDELIASNPARIRGAGTTKRTRDIVLLTPAELVALADKMPPHLAASVLIAGWCGTRWGETFELRRKDLDAECSVLRIRRAVTYRSGVFRVDTPKTDAGLRDVAVPPHIRPRLIEHLAEHVGKGRESLLFASSTGEHLPDYTYRYLFGRAAEAIGKPELRVHDLRHVGAVLAAQAGATTAELMNRLGHTTASMAMKYQHTAAGRDALLAEKLSKLAE
ncbi:integrase [Rhodococcus aetherivorans]|uniref:Integrase n=1 Tax=Rhodococcus aetherivorans TaxID=191292 RepID=A0ABQ0YLQ6_9NOCA|nr:integrase [Rhodococcus aetherivorans]